MMSKKVRDLEDTMDRYREAMFEFPSDESYLDYLAASKEYGEALVEEVKHRKKSDAANYRKVSCSVCQKKVGGFKINERVAFVYDDALCCRCLDALLFKE